MPDVWEPLVRIDTARWIAARQQLHAAAQAAAAPGKQLLPHQPDFSEQSFCWDEAARALAQGVIAGPRPVRSALRPDPPALLLLDGASPAALRELPLDGLTLEDAFGWLESELAALLGRPVAFDRPAEPPPLPTGTGGRFSTADTEAFAALAAWFAGGHRLLAAVAACHPGAAPVRCWPHHFDIATLLPLDEGGDPETARSIGVGLQPGDGARPEPYLYVTPWPYPDAARLPPLAVGCWHIEGWTGAVLEAEALVAAGMAAEQARRAERFLDGAVAACRELLERD